MKHIITLTLVLSLSIPSTVFADLVAPTQQSKSISSEYFVGQQLGKPLISVNLVSGVNRPGVYHIPIGTNLAKLIAYAGGATVKSDLSNISIKTQQEENKYISTNIDLEDILSSSKSIPGITNSDIIHIPQEDTFESSMKWVNLFSGILSVAVSVALINNFNNNNN